MKKCNHPYEKIILTGDGSVKTYRGEYDDDTHWILVCMVCGEEISRNQFERSRKEFNERNTSSARTA